MATQKPQPPLAALEELLLRQFIAETGKIKAARESGKPTLADVRTLLSAVLCQARLYPLNLCQSIQHPLVNGVCPRRPPAIRLEREARTASIKWLAIEQRELLT